MDPGISCHVSHQPTSHNPFNTGKRVSPQEHQVLHAFHHANETGGAKIIELNGNQYRITTNTYKAERLNTNLSDFFGVPGRDSVSITTVLSDHYSTYVNTRNQQRNALLKEGCGMAMSGGGARGATFLGILAELGDEEAKLITEVAGTSAGALTGTLLAIGMPVERIRQIVTQNQKIMPTQADLSQTIEDAIIETFSQTPYIHHAKKVLGEFFKTDDLKNMTFAQLDLIRESSLKDCANCPTWIKKLFISAGSLNPDNGFQGEVKFSAETTPNVPIVKAAIASSAIGPAFDPVIFKAEEIINGIVGQQARQNVRNDGGSIELVDGGYFNQTPYDYLETKNRLILSFIEDKGQNGELGFPMQVGDFYFYYRFGVEVYKPRIIKQAKAESQFGVHYIRSGFEGWNTVYAMNNLPSITQKSAQDFDYYMTYERKQALETIPIDVNSEDNKLS